MMHSGRDAVEDQVAGLQLHAGGDVGAGVVLRLGGARKVDAGRRVGRGGEPGAVEADVGMRRPVPAPLVRQADLCPGKGDRL